jgi:TolA-binding protein
MILRGYINQETLELYRALQKLSDMDRSQSSEAIELSAKAIELDSSGALGYYYLGKALIHNDNEQAEKALYTCLRNSPDDTTAIDAKVHLGLIRQAKGDLGVAYCIWHSVLVHYRDNPHAKFCATLLSLA